MIQLSVYLDLWIQWTISSLLWSLKVERVEIRGWSEQMRPTLLASLISVKFSQTWQSSTSWYSPALLRWMCCMGFQPQGRWRAQMSIYRHFQREEHAITSLFSAVNCSESGRSRGINTGRAGQSRLMVGEDYWRRPFRYHSSRRLWAGFSGAKQERPRSSTAFARRCQQRSPPQKVR